MKESIKIAGGITLKSLGKWILIVFLGCFVTLITFLIAFFWNIDLVYGESSKFSAFFHGLLSDNLPALILVFGAPLFVIGYIVLANKVSIQNIIHLLFKSHAGEYVMSALVGALEKIFGKEGWHTELINKTVLRARVLKEVQEDPNTSAIQKKIIKYGFKKINLEDVNFKDEKLNLSSLLSEKFRHFFVELVKPSLLPFWIMILVQIFLLIISLFLR